MCYHTVFCCPGCVFMENWSQSTVNPQREFSAAGRWKGFLHVKELWCRKSPSKIRRSNVCCSSTGQNEQNTFSGSQYGSWSIHQYSAELWPSSSWETAVRHVLFSGQQISKKCSSVLWCFFFLLYWVDCALLNLNVASRFFTVCRSTQDISAGCMFLL